MRRPTSKEAAVAAGLAAATGLSGLSAHRAGEARDLVSEIHQVETAFTEDEKSDYRFVSRLADVLERGYNENISGGAKLKNSVAQFTEVIAPVIDQLQKTAETYKWLPGSEQTESVAAKLVRKKLQVIFDKLPPQYYFDNSGNDELAKKIEALRK